MVKKIKKNFKKFYNFKPSIVYSVDDKFTTNFMSLIKQTSFNAFIL